MPKAEYDGEKWVHIDEVLYRDRDVIREMPGATYHESRWRFPVSWPGVRILRGLFGDRVDIGPKLKEWLWREYERRVKRAHEWHAQALDPAAGVTLPGKNLEPLYPFQTTGARWLAETQEGAILADEMGTGKTAQTIAALELRSAYPALVVCPKSAKPGWVREFARWAPHRDVAIVGGSALQRRNTLAESHDVFIVHWDALRLHSRLAPYGSTALSAAEKVPKELNGWWGAVVADEAHRSTTPKAKQTRALWAIGDNAGFRVALTGTPIKNNPDDLWAILRFVAPHEWPSRTKYVDRYCETTWNRFGGIDVLGVKAEHAAEFHDLVDLRLLRRPKELVLPWLPPKIYERRDVPMLPGQYRAYEQYKREMVADLDGGTGMALDQLSVWTRLSQLASASLKLEHEEGCTAHAADPCTCEPPFPKTRMCAPSSKIDALVEVLEDMGEDPLIVFAASRQLIDLTAQRLEKEKVSHSMIVGGQSELIRFGSERAFMEGDVRVILLTMGAGSEALTLTRASTMCFMQRSWSLVENLQAEDRNHRPGQEAESVTIIDLVAPGTSDEDQQVSIHNKGAKLEEIVRDRETLLRALTKKAATVL